MAVSDVGMDLPRWMFRLQPVCVCEGFEGGSMAKAGSVGSLKQGVCVHQDQGVAVEVGVHPYRSGCAHTGWGALILGIRQGGVVGMSSGTLAGASRGSSPAEESDIRVWVCASCK